MLGFIVSNIVLGFMPSEKVKADYIDDVLNAGGKLGAQYIIPNVPESEIDRTLIYVKPGEGDDKKVVTITGDTLDSAYEKAQKDHAEYSNPADKMIEKAASTNDIVKWSANEETLKKENKLREKLGNDVLACFNGKSYTVEKATDFYHRVYSEFNVVNGSNITVNRLELGSHIPYGSSTIIWASYSNINSGGENNTSNASNDVNSYIEFISIPGNGDKFKYTLIRLEGLMNTNGALNV